MNIVDKGKGSSGLKTGRRWADIVRVLKKSGELGLAPDEFITEIEIDKDYGLTFKIERQ